MVGSAARGEVWEKGEDIGGTVAGAFVFWNVVQLNKSLSEFFIGKHLLRV